MTRAEETTETPTTEERADSTEERADSTEERADSTEERADSTEERADSTEERADSTEERADSAAERLGGDTVDPQVDAEEHTPETLIPTDRSAEYRSRWDAVKGQFVDDPRDAVQAANTLVGEVLDELEELFRRQRADLEQGLTDESTSTEDLRVALRRYRSFFDRLLSF